MSKNVPSEKVPCPHCGEMIDSHASVCRFCGSDESTGWSQQRVYDGIDLGDGDEDDYNDAVEREFPSSQKKKKYYLSWKSITAVALLLISIIAYCVLSV
ncbi:MAG: hypothetical protein JW795_04230 [Chitinivibrionales bacterium]|nr:hypothetical protein [Chitinivibrionales bacterium]